MDLAALQILGLTDYGARAYAALVGLGQSPAAAISEAAQVPRTKIYAVLDDLVKQEWVVATAGRPKRYRATEPGARIGQARDELLTQVARVETHLSALYHQEGVQFGGAMWVLAGADAIQRRLQRMLADAKTDVFVALAYDIPGDDGLLELLGRTAARGVRVKVLLSFDRAEQAAALRRKNIEVRVGMAPLRVHFADDRNALVAFRKRRDDRVEWSAIWNPHPEMVAQLREVGDPLWMAASE